MTSTLPPTVDPARIQELLDGRWAHVRRDAREHLDDPDFLPAYGESVAEARERVTRATRTLAGSGRARFGFPHEYGGRADAGAAITSIEMLAFGDLSVMVKAASSGVCSAAPSSCSAPSGTTTPTCATSSTSSCPAASR